MHGEERRYTESFQIFLRVSPFFSAKLCVPLTLLGEI
jgi:hypothetical protein